MMRLAIARESKLAAVCATVILKNCSVRLIPPKKKHIPKTRSRFDSILPIKDVCTIITSSWTRAMTDTMSSTAFLMFN